MSMWVLWVNLAGAACVYAANPHRSLASRHRRRLRIAGSVLLLAGLIAAIATQGAGAGTMTALSAWMLAWVALPYLGWWLARRGAVR